MADQLTRPDETLHPELLAAPRQMPLGQASTVLISPLLAHNWSHDIAVDCCDACGLVGDWLEYRQRWTMIQKAHARLSGIMR